MSIVKGKTTKRASSKGGKYTTSLNAFMDGSSFMDGSDSNHSAWNRFEDDNHTTGTGKSFPSTFEMGDMAETSERSRPMSVSTVRDPFAVNEGDVDEDGSGSDDARDQIKNLNDSLTLVLNDFNTWVEGNKATERTALKPAAWKSRMKKRSLEAKLQTWRNGIGKNKLSRRRSTGSTDDLPALVDYSEPDESDNGSVHGSMPRSSGHSSTKELRSNTASYFSSICGSKSAAHEPSKPAILISEEEQDGEFSRAAKKHNSLSSFADSIDSMGYMGELGYMRDQAVQQSNTGGSVGRRAGSMGSLEISTEETTNNPPTRNSTCHDSPRKPERKCSFNSTSMPKDALQVQYDKVEDLRVPPPPRRAARRGSTGDMYVPDEPNSPSVVAAAPRVTMTRRASMGSLFSGVVAGESPAARRESLGTINGICASTPRQTRRSSLSNSDSSFQNSLPEGSPVGERSRMSLSSAIRRASATSSDASRTSIASSRTGVSSGASRASAGFGRVDLLVRQCSRLSMISTMTGDASRMSAGTARTGVTSSDTSRESVVSSKTFQSSDPSLASAASPNSVMLLKERPVKSLKKSQMKNEGSRMSMGSPRSTASRRSSLNSPSENSRKSVDSVPPLGSPMSPDPGESPLVSPRSRKRCSRSRKSMETAEHCESSSRQKDLRRSSNHAPVAKSPSVSNRKGLNRAERQELRRRSLGAKADRVDLETAPTTGSLRKELRDSQHLLARDGSGNAALVGGSEHDLALATTTAAALHRRERRGSIGDASGKKEGVASAVSPKPRRKSSNASDSTEGSRTTTAAEKGVPRTPRSKQRNILSLASLLSPISPKARRSRHAGREGTPRRGRRGSISGAIASPATPKQERPRRRAQRRSSTGSTSADQLVENPSSRKNPKEGEKKRRTSRRGSLGSILANMTDSPRQRARRTSIGTKSDHKKLEPKATEARFLMDLPGGTLVEPKPLEEHSSRTMSQRSGSTRPSTRSEKSLDVFLAAELS